MGEFCFHGRDDRGMQTKITFSTWYSIIAGVLMLGQWGFFLAVGAMPERHYTTIVSLGYFVQLGQWPLVGMFAALLALNGVKARAERYR